MSYILKKFKNKKIINLSKEILKFNEKQSVKIYKLLIRYWMSLR